MEVNIRPRLSHSNSFGNDAEKDTAGCRALIRKYIVIEEVMNMTWIFTPRVERPNQRFPTQAREPPVGEGFGGQSEQAPEGGNDSRLVKGE